MQHGIELQTLCNDRRGLWGAPQNECEQQHEWVECTVRVTCDIDALFGLYNFARVLMQSNVKTQPGMLAIALQDSDKLLFTSLRPPIEWVLMVRCLTSVQPPSSTASEVVLAQID